MNNTTKSNEIDIVGMIKKIFSGWKLIIKCMAIAAAIGVIVALSTPKAYTTEVILAPEISSGGIGLSENLTDMAATFGIDLGGKGQMDALYPEIYPEIFASTDFVISLFDIPVSTKEDTVTKRYRDHLVMDAKMPFWKYPQFLLSQLFSKKKESGGIFDPFSLSRDEELLCENIRGLINCQIDKKTSIITIRMTDMDSRVSAVMADTLLKRLQNYITAYRTSKARNDVKFYEQVLKESRQELEEAQELYARYSDSHINNPYHSHAVKQGELEQQMQIKSQAYSQIEQQLRAAKIRVQENTPAFTVIQSATIPNRASSTPRSLIVLLWMFLGGLGGSLWVLFGKIAQQWWKGIRKSKE